MRIAFYIHGATQRDLERIEFYAQDLRILRELGHDVSFTDSVRAFRGSDLVLCWWWTYSWLVTTFASRHRIPVIATGTFDIDAFPSRPWWQRRLIAWGARRCDENLFVSELERATVSSMLGLRRAAYSPHAIDTAVYSEAAGMPRDDHLVLNVASKFKKNMNRKGLPELIRAMAYVVKEEPEVRLVLAGPPRDGEAYLRRLVDRLGIARNVEFRGDIPRDEKVVLMRRCAIYVQCSRYEGFGVAIAEAMGCGAPVLVSAVGAIPEVVDDCGSYVGELTPAAIAAGIVDLIRKPSRRRELGRAAAARVRREFSVARRMADFEQAIDRVTRR